MQPGSQENPIIYSERQLSPYMKNGSAFFILSLSGLLLSTGCHFQRVDELAKDERSPKTDRNVSGVLVEDQANYERQLHPLDMSRAVAIGYIGATDSNARVLVRELLASENISVGLSGSIVHYILVDTNQAERAQEILKRSDNLNKGWIRYVDLKAH